jgi:metal-responsive CopG/Arc/MetJ family transcriptional regulator
MQPSAKISISLPDRLLRRADKKRKQTGESRSEFFRRAAEELLAAEERRLAVDRYVRGYTASPEDATEVAWLAKASAAAVGEDPWG